MAAEHLLAARLDGGESAMVVPEIEAMLHRAPLREERWRLLALAQYRSQRQADVLARRRRRLRPPRVVRRRGRHTAGVTDSFSDVDITGSFVEHLGVHLQEVGEDRVVATWTARPELHQPFGIVHGGVHCSVVETLASVGAAVWWGDRGNVVGVNNNTDFYRAVSEGRLTSTATPLHQGRSQQVWIVETVSEDGRTVARGQVRLQNLTAREPG